MYPPIYIRKTAVMVFVLGIFGFILHAQEIHIPFDGAGKIYRFAAPLDPKILEVPVPSRFVEAELWQQADSSVFLEIQYSTESGQFRQRLRLSALQLENIRAHVDSVTYIPERMEDDGPGARVFLLGGSLFSGLTTYGPSLPGIFHVTSGRGTAGLYMLGAGSCFFVPYFLTKEKGLTYGQANLTCYGLTRGYLHGVLLANMLSKSYSSNTVTTLGTICGISEAIGGYQFVKRHRVSNGTANLMTVYGDFGLFAGLALANQLHLLNDDGAQASYGLIVASSLGWMAAGYFAGRNNPISTGDAEVISTTGWLGAYLPLTFMALFDVQDGQVITTSMLVGCVAGCYVGVQLAKKIDFSFTQGYTTKLGTLAGGLIGLGAVYLIADRPPGWIYLAGSYIGGQAGFLMLYKMHCTANKNVFSHLRLNLRPENYFITQRNLMKSPQLYSAFPVVQVLYRF